jgi:hypothetical protein
LVWDRVLSTKIVSTASTAMGFLPCMATRPRLWCRSSLKQLVPAALVALPALRAVRVARLPVLVVLRVLVAQEAVALPLQPSLHRRA